MPSFAWKSDVCSRSEEHTSELQSHDNLVCRLLLEKIQSDRKSTRLNSSHTIISYAVFCLQNTGQHLGIRCEIAMAEHCASGPARGARGIEDPRQIIRPTCDIVIFLRVGPPPKFPPFPIDADLRD